VRTAVETFASGFEGRHMAELSDPEGTINMKIHNIFIAALGPEVQYYSALVRSLDSSLGSMLEAMAIGIARLSFDVRQDVVGPLYVAQTSRIAILLEAYRRRAQRPAVSDYEGLRDLQRDDMFEKRHDTDYLLTDRETGDHFLIELKIGGDLDNKKARSEKEALLEQYCILSNTSQRTARIHLRFATAYNRYGEGKPWAQERVRQFFADEEFLISGNFWNFVSRRPDGFAIVIDEYKKASGTLAEALRNVKAAYLPG